MAINQLIAKKYALAAFNVGQKSNTTHQFLTDLEKFVNSFSHDIAEELSNPGISKNDLGKVVRQMADKLGIGGQVANFLVITAEARRIGVIKEVYSNLVKLVKVSKKILTVEVLSVQSLNGEDLQKIKLFLQKKYPHNVIEINPIIKKDILGGVIIKIGSTMIDASLRSQLLSLNNQFQSALY